MSNYSRIIGVQFIGITSDPIVISLKRVPIANHRAIPPSNIVVISFNDVIISNYKRPISRSLVEIASNSIPHTKNGVEISHYRMLIPQEEVGISRKKITIARDSIPIAYALISVSLNSVLTACQAVAISNQKIATSSDDRVIGLEGVVVSRDEVETALKGVTRAWKDGISRAQEIVQLSVDEILVTEWHQIAPSDYRVSISLDNSVPIPRQRVVPPNQIIATSADCVVVAIVQKDVITALEDIATASKLVGSAVQDIPRASHYILISHNIVEIS